MRQVCCLAVLFILFLLSGCGNDTGTAENTILASSYPMYYLASRLTEGMDVDVEILIADQVSCLHNYTLTTVQMKKIERADLLIMNGGGLEDFMTAALARIPEGNRIVADENCDDPHFWLSPLQYSYAAETVCVALAEHYPASEPLLFRNLSVLQYELSALQTEIEEVLSDISCRELITFHDGFFWFADAFHLKIAAAIEEEEGSEISAAEVKEISHLIQEREIPAIFVERNGPTNAASIISKETGVSVYTLNTMMDGETDYFTAMRENAEVIREAMS